METSTFRRRSEKEYLHYYANSHDEMISQPYSQWEDTRQRVTQECVLVFSSSDIILPPVMYSTG